MAAESYLNASHSTDTPGIQQLSSNRNVRRVMHSRSARVCILVIGVLMLGAFYYSKQALDDTFSLGELSQHQSQYHRKDPTSRGHPFNKSARIGSSSSSSSSSSSLSPSSSSLKPSSSPPSPSSSSASSTNGSLDRAKCHEQTSLYFLKVHKAGSTCIQNLFWRFGLSHRLSVMLFNTPSGRVFPHRNFLRYLLPDPKVEMFKGRYDIFCEHSYFDEWQLKQSMQRDTVYIGILREPLSRLRSILHFFGYDVENKSDKVDLAEHLLLSTDRHIPRTVAELLGYANSPPHLFVNDIDSKFKVMVILERLDESLVLMKRKLCWHLKNILYFPMRKMDYTVSNNTANETRLKKRLRERSEVDYLLYEHFVARHRMEVAEAGGNFQEEVQWFARVSDDTKAFCADVCQRLGSSVARRASRQQLAQHLRREQRFPASEWESAFSVSGLDCVMMMFDPIVWRSAQKVTQYPEVCTDPSKTNVTLKRPEFCNEHFAHNFPWEILYEPLKYKTFLFDCY